MPKRVMPARKSKSRSPHASPSNNTDLPQIIDPRKLQVHFELPDYQSDEEEQAIPAHNRSDRGPSLNGSAVVPTEGSPAYANEPSQDSIDAPAQLLPPFVSPSALPPRAQRAQEISRERRQFAALNRSFLGGFRARDARRALAETYPCRYGTQGSPSRPSQGTSSDEAQSSSTSEYPSPPSLNGTAQPGPYYTSINIHDTRNAGQALFTVLNQPGQPPVPDIQAMQPSGSVDPMPGPYHAPPVWAAVTPPYARSYQPRAPMFPAATTHLAPATTSCPTSAYQTPVISYQAASNSSQAPINPVASINIYSNAIPTTLSVQTNGAPQVVIQPAPYTGPVVDASQRADWHIHLLQNGGDAWLAALASDLAHHRRTANDAAISDGSAA